MDVKISDCIRNIKFSSADAICNDVTFFDKNPINIADEEDAWFTVERAPQLQGRGRGTSALFSWDPNIVTHGLTQYNQILRAEYTW